MCVVLDGFLNTHGAYVNYTIKEPLPDIPLYGIMNNRGDKIRLTFKVYFTHLGGNNSTIGGYTRALVVLKKFYTKSTISDYPRR